GQSIAPSTGPAPLRAGVILGPNRTILKSQSGEMRGADASSIRPSLRGAKGSRQEWPAQRPAGVVDDGPTIQVAGSLQGDPMRPIENPAPTVHVLEVPAGAMEADPAGLIGGNGDIPRQINGDVPIFTASWLRKQLDLASPAVAISVVARGEQADGGWPEIN